MPDNETDRHLLFFYALIDGARKEMAVPFAAIEAYVEPDESKDEDNGQLWLRSGRTITIYYDKEDAEGTGRYAFDPGELFVRLGEHYALFETEFIQ